MRGEGLGCREPRQRTQMLMAVKSGIREGQWSEWLRMGRQDHQRTGIQGILGEGARGSLPFGREDEYGFRALPSWYTLAFTV